MNPLRYSTNVRVDRDIPGVKSRGSSYTSPPLNCRNLIVRPPPLTNIEPPWLDPPPEVYAWVIDTFITDYQKQGWMFANALTAAYLYWACGSGKTLAAILWALSARWETKIVIVTKANTKGQWKREFEKFTTLHPTILEGESPTTIDPSIRIIILNWDILPHWVGEIALWQGGHYMSLIYDELHRGKNWKRKEKYVTSSGQKSWRAMDNQANAAARLSGRSYRRLGLSATPIRNTVADLWAQFDLLEPGCWGNNWDFTHRYCDAREGKHGGLDTSGKSNIKELKARIRMLCHKVSYEEMARDLPPKRRQLCYLSREEQSRPAAFSQDMRRAAKKGKQALFEMKLLEAASRKRAWIVDVVTDAVANGQKVVVFTGRRNDCERLAEAIGKACKKMDAPFWWGHGGTPAAQREQDAHVYGQCQEPCAFVGTTDAFGEGIDGLQHTDLAMFGLLPWTPGQVTQAEGRFSRKGQTRPVLIMYTVAEGTVDEHVADLVLSKLESVSEVLDDSEARGVAAVLGGEADEDEIVTALLAKL